MLGAMLHIIKIDLSLTIVVFKAKLTGKKKGIMCFFVETLFNHGCSLNLLPFKGKKIVFFI